MTAGISIVCNHTNHLFFDPLCKEQSVLRRIFNIVFHILTLGIPFLFYHIVAFCTSCCHKRDSFTIRYDIDNQLLGRGFDSLITNSRIDALLKKGKTKNLAIPPEGLDALRFARAELRQYYALGSSDIIKDKLETDNSKNPINKEIIILKYLYNNIKGSFYSRFQEQLQKYSTVDPWKEQDVFDSADKAIKIAYALSVLALDDVNYYCRKHNLKDKEMLCSPNYPSYFLGIYYTFTLLYRNVRSQVVWSKKGKMRCPMEPSLEHANLFFENIDNKWPCCMLWRSLYNDHCHRLKCHFNEEVLMVQFPKLMLWFMPDLNKHYFCYNPNK